VGSRNESLFGSKLRERILKLLVLVEPAYPRQIATLLGEHLVSVQNAIEALQNSGIIATRLMGTTRLVELDPRWYAADELRSLLERMAAADDELRATAATVRQRPRRAGKPV
jgi:DNA-binding transcriptional ArsR family regulator